jgi:toxin-antitoxin system PIN domain toxin
MLAVDTNVLVYAHRREAAEHDVAYEVIRSLAEGTSPWAIPWPCVYEFFSVVTNRRIWKDATSSPAQAWQQLEAWFESPTLKLIGETADFSPVLGQIAQRTRVRGSVIHDARIAAICLAHGVEKLLTRDRDFSLFPELVREDPF